MYGGPWGWVYRTRTGRRPEGYQSASQPADRITMINDKLLRQGDLLAPGLRLEQITADGVILSYKGYRFHHGVR